MRNAVSARKSVRYTVFLLLPGCGKLEFKTSGLRSLLTLYNFLLDNRCDLSDLRIAVKVQSSQFVDSHKFRWDSCFIYIVLERIFIIPKETDGCGL